MRSHFLRNITDISLFLITFLLLQLVSTLMLPKIIHDGILAITLGYALSAILTIALFHFANWSRLSTSYFNTNPFALLTWIALLSIGLIAPSQYAQDFIGADMPEATKQLLETIISQPMGYIIIGLLAPIAEEMVFRGAILRVLLKFTKNPWSAIVISAFIFGIIHGNIPQFIHAFIIGLLLGWTYYRTGSILPGIVFHWVNNSTAFLLYKIFPGKTDAKLIELCNGNTVIMYSVLAISFLLVAVSFWQVTRTIGMRKGVKYLKT